MAEIDRLPKTQIDNKAAHSGIDEKKLGSSSNPILKPRISDKIFDGLREEDREKTEFLDEGKMVLTKMI
jgi:hypothetical protein